jgi:hypothetical protein
VETIHHVITGCPVLAPTDYKNRHDQVAKIIHIELAKFITCYKLHHHITYICPIHTWKMTQLNYIGTNRLYLIKYWNIINQI